MTLLEALKTVHERMKDEKNWTPCGICSELRDLDHDDYDADELDFEEQFIQLYMTWDKFSGEKCFPLPGEREAYNAARKTGFHEEYMWDRKTSHYAKLRWELLEWAIERLENE